MGGASRDSTGLGALEEGDPAFEGGRKLTLEWMVRSTRRGVEEHEAGKAGTDGSGLRVQFL